jgi:ATP/maltotriose-dependent transcriptional regulator MalT
VSAHSRRDFSRLFRLSSHEIKVGRLAAVDLGNREIAEALHVIYHTVVAHMGNDLHPQPRSQRERGEEAEER